MSQPITLNVIDSWEDNSFQGEIIITNNTDASIECWELDIDSNFTIAEITNSWAAIVSAYEEGKYTLKGTYTNIIYPNSSTTLGFLGIKNGEPEIYNYSLTEIVIGEVSKSEENNDDAIVSVEGMYYKDIQSDDEVDYDGNGIYFVRNQLLITAYQNVSFEEVEVLVDEINAKIVGYIGITNDYQIEFNTDVSTEYLYQQIDILMNNSLVEYVSLNTAFKTTNESIASEYSFDWEQGEDDNWHIDAINAPDAWTLYWNAYNPNNIVRIGIIDNGFDYKHNDLIFKKIWQNPPYDDDNYKPFFDHGTHVSGIIGAEWNGIGVAGICPQKELYGYAVNRYMSEYDMMMKYKMSIATLIVNNVKVINMSIGNDDEICIGATYGNRKAERFIKSNSLNLGKFLNKLIDLEYDFLIVSAAGNSNDDIVIYDIGEYGCEIDSGISEMRQDCARAEYNSIINYMSNRMTDAEKEKVSIGELTLLDNTYAYPWEFNRADTEKIRDYVSEILFYDEELDANFVVHVTTPPDYDEKNSYPAFVLTDGVWRFGNHSALWELMENDEADDVLLVSIGFDFEIDNTGDSRGYFMNEKKEEFLDFITDNLMTYLDSKYNIDESSSALYGHSNGGAFTHYAAFNSDLYENQPFHYYIIGSPAFWSPYFLPFQEEPGDYKREYDYFVRNKTMDKELYLCAGEHEDSDYEEYYGENDSTLEGVAHFTERLDSYGFAGYTNELYDSNHYEYIPEMLETVFLKWYGK